jgi:hypothetical protein
MVNFAAPVGLRRGERIWKGDSVGGAWTDGIAPRWWAGKAGEAALRGLSALPGGASLVSRNGGAKSWRQGGARGRKGGMLGRDFLSLSLKGPEWSGRRFEKAESRSACEARPSSVGLKDIEPSAQVWFHASMHTEGL